VLHTSYHLSLIRLLPTLLAHSSSTNSTLSTPAEGGADTLATFERAIGRGWSEGGGGLAKTRNPTATSSCVCTYEC